MKAVFVSGPSTVNVQETPQPQVGPGDILVRMNSCGICGSDVEKVFGQYGKPSMRLGHEPAGTIMVVGSKVSGFEKGDRVFTHHHVPCYSCHFCRHGNETMCPKYYQTNLFPCGLSEQYVVPEWNVTHGGVLKLPDHVSFDEASMIEPLACCLRAWTKFSFQGGDTAAIFGAGPTGIMHGLVAKINKFSEVFCLDVNQYRLDFAQKLGLTSIKLGENFISNILAQTQSRGVDVSIVATSNTRAIIDAISVTRKGGFVVLFGVPSKGAILEVDISQVYSKEITLVPSYAASDKDTKNSLELISSGKIDVKKLITHKYSIGDSQKAFEHAHTGIGAMKIIING